MACAGCKLMRRRCSPDCFLAPYFPGDDPQRFACVHYVYGTSNVTKMLQDVPPNQRAIAAETLYQEANARLKDPVYGCIGDIASLNQQIYDTQGELAEVRAQFAVFTGLNTQKDLFVGDYVPSYGLVEVPEAEGASSSKLGVVEVPVAEGVLYRKLGNNVPSYFAPGNYSLLQGAVEVPVAEGALSKKLGNNGPSYGAPSNYSLLQGLVEVPVAEDASSDKLGNKRKRNYKGVRQTSAGNWIAQVHVGTFKTAEDAAMAYDKAALELHGHEARLNFPDSEAFPYVSYADSAQLLSSGENSPSKRRRDSQSAPGSVSAPLSHKDGFNQTSSVLSDLLDSFLEHGSNSSMVSLLLASLEQQTVGELTYGSATQSTLSHMFSEDIILPWLHQNTENCIQATEGNVEDSPCQAEPMQNGISVHHDGSKSVVKVIEIKEESQEA